ncbi:hypothetical protein FOZ61_007066 [Perkinsus olseni]|uniref:malate dehydrogenase n=2 Tax=Perkinsus olseni TaxID=32597 RepID=A0A7J6LAJ7_PEROL|nr:hypothetical protein FOZ61_007066 [Perkinsus olseni]KAF4659648.1 hypothetical protein FOL46_006517 [Perkinsus olseni]
MKVCLIGASGGIGRPLALLLKMNPEIDEVALYDVPGAHFPVPGVVADLSHINTPAKVTGYQGFDEIADCLDGAHMIIVTAGIAQKPGMTRDDLFNVNARIMRDLSFKFAKHAPAALVCIMSNPETALVPITCEVYKQVGVFDKRKIMGLMSLDVTRARTFYAEATNQDVEKVDVPVIGGHGGCAILPVFSHATPYVQLDDATIAKLDDHVQNAVTEVVDALAGAGSASLSMAYAANRFAGILIQGMKGKPAKAAAYINEPYEGVNYFAHYCDFGPEGVSKIHSLSLSPFEQSRLPETLDKLRNDIGRGMEFLRRPSQIVLQEES